jgi:DNA-binding NtrC family response regulator
VTRVLVVHHDIDVADIEVDELRRAGYEVDQCAGPIGSDACPVLRGEPCWQVAEADVLVYDMWASGDGSRELIEELRDLHPDKPLVVTSPGLVLDWVETEGPHNVTPVLGAPTREDLVAAVKAAIEAGAASRRDQKKAEPPAEPPAAQKPETEHIPRW